MVHRNVHSSRQGSNPSWRGQDRQRKNTSCSLESTLKKQPGAQLCLLLIPERKGKTCVSEFRSSFALPKETTRPTSPHLTHTLPPIPLLKTFAPMILPASPQFPLFTFPPFLRSQDQIFSLSVSSPPFHGTCKLQQLNSRSSSRFLRTHMSLSLPHITPPTCKLMIDKLASHLKMN